MWNFDYVDLSPDPFSRAERGHVRNMGLPPVAGQLPDSLLHVDR